MSSTIVPRAKQISIVPNEKTQRETRISRVSVVIPVFNEEEGLCTLLQTLARLETNLGNDYQFEFIIVDDGSDDDTAELLTQALEAGSPLRVLRHPENRGIAAAIHTGIMHAESEIVVSLDSDGSYDPMQLAEMLPGFTPEVDLLIASPYHPAGRVENMVPWRLFLSQQASRLYRLAMRRKLYCYTSCFRVYRRSRFTQITPKHGGFVGIAELLWIADNHGLHIVEHPAVLRTRQVGTSKMKIGRAAVQHLTMIAAIATHRLTRRLPKNDC